VLAQAASTYVISTVCCYAVGTYVVCTICGYAVGAYVISTVCCYAVCVGVDRTFNDYRGVAVYNRKCEGAGSQYREGQAEDQF